MKHGYMDTTNTTVIVHVYSTSDIDCVIACRPVRRSRSLTCQGVRGRGRGIGEVFCDGYTSFACWCGAIAGEGAGVLP